MLYVIFHNSYLSNQSVPVRSPADPLGVPPAVLVLPQRRRRPAPVHAAVPAQPDLRLPQLCGAGRQEELPHRRDAAHPHVQRGGEHRRRPREEGRLPHAGAGPGVRLPRGQVAERQRPAALGGEQQQGRAVGPTAAGRIDQRAEPAQGDDRAAVRVQPAAGAGAEGRPGAPVPLRLAAGHAGLLAAGPRAPRLVRHRSQSGDRAEAAAAHPGVGAVPRRAAALGVLCHVQRFRLDCHPVGGGHPPARRLRAAARGDTGVECGAQFAARESVR